MGEALKTFGAMKKMCNVRNVSLSLNSELDENVVIPTLIYRAETWDVKEKEQHEFVVMERKCRKSICGATRIKEVRNEEVRHKVGMRANTIGRVDQIVLNWLGRR